MTDQCTGKRWVLRLENGFYFTGSMITTLIGGQQVALPQFAMDAGKAQIFADRASAAFIGEAFGLNALMVEPEEIETTAPGAAA